MGQPPWLAYAAMVVPTASAFCCVQKRQHALPVRPQQRMDWNPIYGVAQRFVMAKSLSHNMLRLCDSAG